jgi:hypothetical protein
VIIFFRQIFCRCDLNGDQFQVDINGYLITESFACNNVSASDPIDANDINAFTAANELSSFGNCADAQAAYMSQLGYVSGSYCGSQLCEGTSGNFYFSVSV